MFKIEKDFSIHITRGDIATLGISADGDNGTYEFQVGDIIRLGVFKKDDYSTIVLQKDITVNEKTTEVSLSLTSEDTKIGEIINEPIDYWYEIQLNPDTQAQTIIGYDKKGAKIFRLYPEGVEEE